jgi:hypothetical protein
LEEFFGRKPDLSNLRVFGSVAYFHIPKERRKKLDATSEKGTFLGYDMNSSAWRILKKSGRIELTCSADFEESPSRKQNQALPQDLREETQLPGRIPVQLGDNNGGQPNPNGNPKTLNPAHVQAAYPGPFPSESTTSTGTGDNTDDEMSSNEREIGQPMVRRSNRENIGVPPVRFEPNVNLAIADGLSRVSFVAIHEPQTLKEAMASPQADLWEAAINEEMASLLENETWDLVPCPRGIKAIPSKYVFKLKTDPAGNIERFKARLVIKGFKQTEGIDFNEVFAPVARHTTLRTLLAVAAEKDWNLFQLDIKTAFLNGRLEETEAVYMEPPEGFQQGEPGIVCRLKKALYGLKQAPRAWYLKLKSELRLLGFQASTTDPALFMQGTGEDQQFLMVWVDDMIQAGHNQKLMAKIRLDLNQVFEVKDLGELTHFLGMEIHRNREQKTIFLSQKKYCEELLEKWDMTEAKARKLPIGPGEVMHREGETLNTEQFPYLSLVGGLLYLSCCTRPDISFAVGTLSRFMSSPTENHWAAAKGILKYLVGTTSYGLQLGSEQDLVFGFCDADFAADTTSRKSTTGFMFKVFGGTVNWSSKLQATVALSTVEAEYVAAASAAKEALWLRKILQDFGYQVPPIHIWEDNQGCLKLLKHPMASQRSKHIDLQWHFVRERISRGEVEFEYIAGEQQLADFLTKSLPFQKFEFCRNGANVEAL